MTGPWATKYKCKGWSCFERWSGDLQGLLSTKTILHLKSQASFPSSLQIYCISASSTLVQQRDPCSVLKNSRNCWHSQLLEHEISANIGPKQVLSFCLKKDPLLKSFLPPSEQSGFLFRFILFSQMLKRSKGQISSLSLLQPCSNNRNRNCWRPGKSDLKRFRDGKTHWLSQEGFCYCSSKDRCVFISYFLALCDASL